MNAQLSNEASLRLINADLRTRLEAAENLVRELEEQLGLTPEHEAALAALGLRPNPRCVARLLLKHDLVSIDRVRFALERSLYHLAEDVSNRLVYVHVWAARGALRHHGIIIRNKFKVGWWIDGAGKARLRALISALETNANAPIASGVGGAAMDGPSLRERQRAHR